MKSYKQLKKKFDTKLVVIILYIILIVAISSLIFSMLNGDKKDNFFGYTLRLVVSGSMEPEINVNSINIIKTSDIDDINIGDIICFNYNQDIVHRVIDKKTNENGVVVLNTKGDANEMPDSIEITNEMIIGKVIFTWNNIAPLIEKYSIEPGKVDSITLARNIMIYIIIAGTIIIILISILKELFNFIKSLIKSKDFDNAIETYIDDIDELILYRELLRNLKYNEIKNDSEHRFEYIGNRISKAIILNKCRELHLDINRFKHNTRQSIFWYKLFKSFDINNSKERVDSISNLLNDNNISAKLDDTNTNNADTNTKID